MVAMLLCAGLGTRFRPHTDKMAKPCLPFLNVPLMAYSLYYLEKLGIDRLVINTHHLPHTVELTMSCLSHGQNYKPIFSHEAGQILGSGGGIRKAQHLLSASDDFVVANGDEVILFGHNFGMTPLYEFHKKSGALATLLTTNHPEAGKTFGGVWTDAENKITRIGDKDGSPGAKHFTGAYVFSPRIFDYMPPGGEFHIFKDCLLPAISKGEKVFAFHDPKLMCLEIGSEKDHVASTRAALEALRDETVHGQCLEGILKRFGQNFSRAGKSQFLCPGAACEASIDSDALVFMGENAHIDATSAISGFAVLGANSIFHNGKIESSSIAPQIHVNELVAIRKQLIL